MEEDDDLVKRKVYAEVLLHVEYPLAEEAGVYGRIT
jgi:DNA-binding HxlR family transcriptional regulator